MDEPTYNMQQDFPHYGYVPARNNGFMIVSLIMGIFSILSSSFIITGIFFGGLGILFAVLSKGGDHSFTKTAAGGVTTSVIGIALSLCIGIFSFYLIFTDSAYHQQLNDMCEQMYGVTFDELLDGEPPKEYNPYNYYFDGNSL